MHANVLHFYTPLTPVWRQKVKPCYGAHHIMQLMHTIDLLGWVKGHESNYADKYNLIVLSDLIAE